MKDINKGLIYTISGAVIILVLWQLASWIVAEPIILPGPVESFSSAISLLGDGGLYSALLSTGLRALIGFALSFLTASLLAVLAYIRPVTYNMLAPLVTVLRSVPTMSIILIAIIWLAPGVSPVLIGFLIIFPTLYESIHSALCGVDKDLIEMSKVYRVSTKKQILSLYLPSVRKSVLSSARSAISLNVKVVIAGEVLAYTASSIGMQMYVAQLSIATATLFGWTVYAVLLSFVFEGIIVAIDRLTDPIRIRNRRRAKKSV